MKFNSKIYLPLKKCLLPHKNKKHIPTNAFHTGRVQTLNFTNVVNYLTFDIIFFLFYNVWMGTKRLHSTKELLIFFILLVNPDHHKCKTNSRPIKLLHRRAILLMLRLTSFEWSLASTF